MTKQEIGIQVRRLWQFYSLPQDTTDPELNELLDLMTSKVSGEAYDSNRYFFLLDIYTNSYQF
jgi:hypothetical protein